MAERLTIMQKIRKEEKAEKRRAERIAPREPPRSLRQAGAAYRRGGRSTPASIARQATATSRWQQREDERVQSAKDKLYDEEAAARQTVAGLAGRLAEQQLSGAQQMDQERFRAKTGTESRLAEIEAGGAQQMKLAEFQAEQGMAMLGEKGKQAERLAGMKLPQAGKGLLTQKQRADLESGLRSEYYDEGLGGEEIRKTYNSPNAYVGYGMRNYSGAQPAQGQLPAPAGQPSGGTVTGFGKHVTMGPGGDMETAAIQQGVAGLPESSATEDYVSGVRSRLPQQPQQAVPVAHATQGFQGDMSDDQFEPLPRRQGGVSTAEHPRRTRVSAQGIRKGIGALGRARKSLGRFVDPNYSGREKRTRTIPYGY